MHIKEDLNNKLLSKNILIVATDVFYINDFILI